ncbi:hypothetical protein WT98_00015 [Burkholderia territorii]|nr:hypothetical protein WT98_00015 [Burkholderia territorii]
MLLVVLRPVDSEFTPLCAVLMPVEADVDSELIELVADDRPVDVDVDSEATLEPTVLATEYNSLPFTASVLVALIRPAATFCTRRSVPTAPTLTTPAAPLVPANPP